MFYCTLAQMKSELKATATTDDSIALNYIRQVSARIDNIMNPRARRPWFGPWVEQRAYPLEMQAVESWRNVFHFRQPLLSFSEVLLDATDITSVVEAFPKLERIIKALRFTTTSRNWYETVSSDGAPSYVFITGTWGYQSDFSEAWPEYDTLQADITAAALTGTVEDANGTDPFGFTPRFSPGALVKIDSEYMELTAVNTTTNVLTWRRGVHGTTAAAHLSAASVQVWQVEDSIRRICQRQAAMMYARRGAFQVETLDGIGTISFPQDLLSEMRAVLQEYANA